MKKQLPEKKHITPVYLLRGMIRRALVTLCVLCSLNYFASAQTCNSNGNGTAVSIVYKVNGSVVPNLNGVQSGDHVNVCFNLSGGCTPTIFTLVAYKAPGNTFNSATASLQTIYSVDTKTVSSSGCLDVDVPSCNFQVDFVKGCPIVQFGPDGSNNFYGAQHRLIAGVNGGNGTCNCVANANAGANVNLNCSDVSVTLSGTSYTHEALVNWQAYAGGHISSGGNTFTPVINASGTYVMTVTDTLNCTASDTVTVTGHTNVLTAGIIGNDQSNCGPFVPDTLISVADATANPGESIAYLWLQSPVNVPNTPGNPYWTAIGGANGASYFPGLISTTTYFVRCSRTIGCTFLGPATESNIIGVIINPTVSVDLGADVSLGSCTGSVMLDAGNPGMSYLWNTGATTQTINATAAGMYYVTVTNQYGCSDTDTINVTGSGSLTVNLGADVILCAGGNITLDAGNAGSTFSWSTGASTQTINVSTTGTYYVTVTNGGCSVSDTIDVTVLPVLNVDLGADITASACAGAVTLDAGNAGMTYLWSNSSLTQTINVTSSGTYYVTVTNSGGCMESDTVNVTFTPPSFSVDLGLDTLLCAGGSMMLDAGNPGMNFSWSTGATTQTISVNTSGTYYVTVSTGTCSVSDTVNVTVLPSFNVNLGNDTTVVLCTGFLTLDAGNPSMTYMWSTGATSQTINVTASGMYYVNVTNSGGCVETDSINVMVNQGSTSVNIGNDTSYLTCTHETLTLDAGNAGTYLWNTGLTTETLVVSVSGTYYVTVTDARGCMATDSINVNITDNTIDLDLGSDTVVCGCLTLNAGMTGITNYLWCNGQTYPTQLVCSTGVYCVTVGNGTCMASDTISVTINTAPVVNLGADTTLSVAAMFTIDAGNPGMSYLWSNGETTQSISVISSGTYYVTVTDQFGCTGTDSITVSIPIGITERTLNEFHVDIFPNPSNGNDLTLGFNVPESTNVEIRILNVLGKVMYSETLENFKGVYSKKVAADDLAAGIYFANVRKGKTNIVTKFTVQK